MTTSQLNGIINSLKIKVSRLETLLHNALVYIEGNEDGYYLDELGMTDKEYKRIMGDDGNW